MKLFKHLTLLIGTLFMAGSISAQDIHFSQFYLSPLNLNPAMTGVMSCSHRLTVNYRNQWASVLKSNAYNTYSVGYDARIPVGRYDNFGIGASFWGDQAGELSFSTMEARLHAAYSKRLSGNRKKANYLVAGVEAGAAQRSIDFLAARWGTQNDGGVFNPNLPSQEEFDYNNFLFADVSAGLLWYGIVDENTNYYVGAAFSHLNRANQSFNDGNEDDEAFEAYYSKITVHAGADWLLGDRLALLPGIVVLSQGPSLEVNGGTSVKFKLGNTSSRGGSTQAFHVGAWARVSNFLDQGVWMDAVVLSTRFDFNEFTLGFSYDVNVSNLQPASNSNGAYELSLIYKVCNPDRRGVFCPDF